MDGSLLLSVLFHALFIYRSLMKTSHLQESSVSEAHVCTLLVLPPEHIKYAGWALLSFPLIDRKGGVPGSEMMCSVTQD